MKKYIILLFLCCAFANAYVKKPVLVRSGIKCSVGTPCHLLYKVSTLVLQKLNSNLKVSQRTKLINGIIKPHFSFELMTKLAIGKNWKLANKKQQQQLVHFFEELLIHTYSSALISFKGAVINIQSQVIHSNTAAIILYFNSDNSTSKSIKVEYDLIKLKNKWLVYDLKIVNASLVTVYRNQFNEIISHHGIKGLLVELQKKTKRH